MVNKRANEIWHYMQERVAETGIVPTTREIAAHFRLKSHGTVVYHLAALQKEGLLFRKGRRWGLRESSSWQDIPVYGHIPAGYAEEVVSGAISSVRMDLASFGIQAKGETFLLRVRGDSMEGARIFEGDLALMEKAEPRPGQIVAALIDGESTLKTYFLRDGVPYLRPENPKYPELTPVQNLEIQGVLLLTFRRP